MHLRDAPFCHTGARARCCDPQAAEQNPSWDFTPLPPISSLPHLLGLSFPPHLSFSFTLPGGPPLVGASYGRELAGCRANRYDE